MMAVFLRLFVETSADHAPAIAERLRQALESVAPRAQVKAVRQYWKIPEYQELQLDLGMVGDAAHAVSSVIGLLGTGWTRQSGTEAIWNSGSGSTFADPNVRWAHVEVIESTGTGRGF